MEVDFSIICGTFMAVTHWSLQLAFPRSSTNYILESHFLIKQLQLANCFCVSPLSAFPCNPSIIL